MLAPRSQTSDLRKCEKWVSVVYKPECVLRCFSSWIRQRARRHLSEQPRASHWSVDRLRGQARWAWSALFCTASCVEKVTNKQSFWERSKECCDWHCPDRFILVSLGLDKCLACLENNAKESFFHQRPNVAAFNRHNISSKTEIRADKRATISLLLWKQNELYLSEINPLNEISGRIHSPENMTEKIIHYYLCI